MKVVDIKPEDKPLMTTKDLKLMLESMSLIAQANWAYYNSLTEQGFSAEQALEIIKAHKFW